MGEPAHSDKKCSYAWIIEIIFRVCLSYKFAILLAALVSRNFIFSYSKLCFLSAPKRALLHWRVCAAEWWLNKIYELEEERKNALHRISSKRKRGRITSPQHSVQIKIKQTSINSVVHRSSGFNRKLAQWHSWWNCVLCLELFYMN